MTNKFGVIYWNQGIGMVDRVRPGWLLTMALLLCAWWSQTAVQAAPAEIEPNATVATATPIDASSGHATVTGTISPVGDSDYYSVVVPANSRIWVLVDTGGPAGGGSSSRDSFLTLLAADGSTILETDDDDGSGTGGDTTRETSFASAIAGRQLTQAGKYFIRVQEYNDDGMINPYQLSVLVASAPPGAELENNNTTATAQSLVDSAHALGMVSGNISNALDLDVYSVQVPAGAEIHVSLDADPNRDGFGSDFALEWIAPNGSSVLFTADSSTDEGGGAEAFNMRIETAGTYFVRVSHNEGAMGNYVLAAGIPGQGVIEFDQATFQNLETPGQANIRVVRRGNTAGSASVRFGTANGTASAPSDYATNGGVLNFPAGVSTQIFGISLVSDLNPEPNETVILTLQNPVGAILGTISNSFLAIVDNDEAPNQTPGTATALDVRGAFGSARGSLPSTPLMISPAGDEDWYSFSAPANARAWIFVDTGGVPNPASISRDSQLTLLGSDGITIIEEDDDDGSGNGCGPVMDEAGGQASAIAGCVLSGGTYHIKVGAFGGDQIIDPYDVFVAVTTDPPLSEVEPNEGVPAANPIVTEALGTGHRLARIDTAGDVDLYAVVASTGSVLFVSADCDPYRTGLGTDLVVDLLATNGNTVLFSADSSGGQGAAAEAFCFRIAQAGTYFVRVKHYLASGSGPYGLMVSRSPGEYEPNDSTVTAVRLNLAAVPIAFFGTITPAGDSDLFVFSANAGDQLWASVDTGGLQRAGANSRDSLLTLLAANGSTVVEQDADDGSGNGGDGTLESGEASSICGRSLAVAGTYYLRVRGSSAGQVINPYRLFVALRPAPGGVESEPNNTIQLAQPFLTVAKALETRPATIGAAGDVDCYSVVAAAGDTIDLAINGDPERDGVGTDVIVELVNPTGQIIFLANSSAAGSAGDPAGEAFRFVVPSSGLYVIRVRHASASGTGSYHIFASRDRTSLVLVSVVPSAGGRTLGFTTMPQRRYYIEALTNLDSEEQWHALPGTIVGTGGVETYFDPGTGSSNLFFRAVQVP